MTRSLAGEQSNFESLEISLEALMPRLCPGDYIISVCRSSLFKSGVLIRVDETRKSNRDGSARPWNCRICRRGPIYTRMTHRPGNINTVLD